MEFRCLNYPHRPECKGMIPHNEQKRGPRPLFCSGACKTAWHRRYPGEVARDGQQAERGEYCPTVKEAKSPSRHDRSSNGQHQREKCPVISPPALISLPVIPPVKFVNNHQILPVNGVYICQVCGWSWSQDPQWSCPGVHLYTQEEKPAYLITREELVARGLFSTSEPDAAIYRENKRKGSCQWYFLYDEKKSWPNNERRYQMLKSVNPNI